MTFRQPIFHKIFARFAAKVDDVVNLTPRQHPNPTRPWAQYDWPRATDLPKLKAVGEPIGRVMPLLTPNPPRPFKQTLWENPVGTRKAIVDDFVNTPKAAAVVQPPFSQADWPLAAPAQRKIIDTSVGPPVPPAQPFNQNLWEGAKPLPKAIGEAAGGIAPLLTPNPAQPFNQTDWPQARPLQKAKVDEFVNLPRTVVVVSPPFVQSDWPLTARVRLPIADASIAAALSANFPNPARPFSQQDWPGPQGHIFSDRGVAFGLNQNFPPPVVATGFLHAQPFLAMAGMMMHLPSVISTGGALTPPDGLIAEDGVTFLVAEDGTTFLVKE